MTSPRAYTTDPRRDTNLDYFLDRDPLAEISPSIVEFIRARAGQRILDLGCGVGGYSYRLQQLGFDVTATDRHPEYVKRARALGVNAEETAGESLQFPDRSFDTVFLVEVLEHIPDETIPKLLGEVRRVARKNVLITVPDCEQTQELRRHALVHEHYLTVDHVQFFTQRDLAALLGQFFRRVRIERGDPVYPHRLLPSVVRQPLSLLYRLGLLQPNIFSRLYVEALTDA